MKDRLGAVIGGILGFTCGLIASMLPCVADEAGLAATTLGGGSSGPMRPQPAAASATTVTSATLRKGARDKPLGNTSDSE